MKDSIDRAKIVRANLEAISRGRSPSPETVGVWLREFQPIKTDKLDDIIRQARTEHSERVEMGKAWGHITPDDVLRVHRRLRRKLGPTNEPPENPDCPHGCQSGRVSVRDGKGYEYCVRCSCSAGDWWKSQRTFGQAPSVDVCLSRPGWSLIGSTRKVIPQTHQEWIDKRAQDVGIGAALSEYSRWKTARGG